MDDFNVSSLNESRNEWSSRLLGILTPLIIDGYKSILDESLKLCKENNEINKYLMTFQNLISRVPKWNATIIENERKRICEKSGCNYLEDLVTCVHILQLKILTAMRVGQKQKKIDINIPKIDDFIHKCYINAARKIYKNVYLFQTDIPPLQIQKNYRELENIIHESIITTLRESIPVESILRAYMDETVEEDVVEEIKEQILEEPKQRSDIKLKIPNENNNFSENSLAGNPYLNQSKTNTLKFNDIDYISNSNGDVSSIVAPKTIDRLEQISEIRSKQRKQDEEDDDDNVKITISNQPVSLDLLDVHNIEEPKLDLLPDLLLDEIEILD
jgi:hypothetical protein